MAKALHDLHGLPPVQTKHPHALPLIGGWCLESAPRTSALRVRGYTRHRRSWRRCRARWTPALWTCSVLTPRTNAESPQQNPASPSPGLPFSAVRCLGRVFACRPRLAGSPRNSAAAFFAVQLVNAANPRFSACDQGATCCQFNWHVFTEKVNFLHSPTRPPTNLNLLVMYTEQQIIHMSRRSSTTSGRLLQRPARCRFRCRVAGADGRSHDHSACAQQPTAACEEHTMAKRPGQLRAGSVTMQQPTRDAPP